MLTKPLALLCSSEEHWQRRAQLSYWLGRWIINFQISTFCLTAAALPQRKRRWPGWQHVLPKLLASLWSWAVHGCMSLELHLDLHVDVTSFCWQDSQLNMQPAPRWRVLKDAAASLAAWGSLQCSVPWAGQRAGQGLGAALSVLFASAIAIWNQDSYFFFFFFFNLEN